MRIDRERGLETITQAMRKIIQIAATGGFESETDTDPGELWALCDDGTLWLWIEAISGIEPGYWKRWKEIPQG